MQPAVRADYITKCNDPCHRHKCPNSSKMWAILLTLALNRCRRQFVVASCHRRFSRVSYHQPRVVQWPRVLQNYNIICEDVMNTLSCKGRDNDTTMYRNETCCSLSLSSFCQRFLQHPNNFSRSSVQFKISYRYFQDATASRASLTAQINKITPASLSFTQPPDANYELIARSFMHIMYRTYRQLTKQRN